MHNYSQDGAQRHHFNAPDVPAYARNPKGGPVADASAAGEGGWQSDGELVRAAATGHVEDSDFGQAGTLYRHVFDDAAKARFLETLTGQGSAITVPEIRERFFRYWSNVDAKLGAALRQSVAVPSASGNAAAEPVGVSNLSE